MREGTTIEVSAADRARLEAVVADRNSPQKHVWRARIILAAAEGLGTSATVRRTGKSKPCVRRWRERFVAEGGDGLLRDKNRPPGTPPLPETLVERVVGLTRRGPPCEATHWTGRGHGEGGRDQPGRGARDLEGARARPAPGADLQAVQGSRVHRQVARRGRPLHA